MENRTKCRHGLSMLRCAQIEPHTDWNGLKNENPLIMSKIEIIETELYSNATIAQLY